ncbi:putative AlkP superfamily pyrophosphatase or phosphodiesterase [Wenyingzhuangia heitensis]|uniref:AlkP superfamily pyrophosphatase or phosphodiesterase n=1 Tax=Wenyingzhuangia heitensis TaxID=1487859 RepID=A0ABX0UEY9_9FLAO|nr:alkaline phosphatase PafA [Wenyingzhuangia heitensis]NIJ46101.1 putative AlkP superfamily pyrophosphatase or phosphodiesterase [Wenyingzhuangia heitensis]
MKKLLSLLLVCNICILNAQKKPKLVVGIVVDQMRYDYLLRFNDKFGSKGFNKLIENGTTYENGHYNYIPTYTAVGHTSVYTGTTPKNHGIVGNNWYDKFEQKSIYVVDDANYKTVGSESKEGQKSPYRLIASTIADQLKVAQDFKGKSIGIAIKDRSAILPVGHTADVAYWFDGANNGKWITSSYYTDKLPNWVNLYNTENKLKLDEYLASPWVTSKKIEDYTECTTDHNYFEGTFHNEDKPIFPHNLPSLKEKNGNYSLLKSTPFGNTMTLDFAKQIIKNEELGKDKTNSDFLAVSLSSTDYIGHKYGPASVEIEDTYIRLNKDLDDFISYLNSKVGNENYVLFLTADHAVVQVPHYLIDHKAPGGYFSNRELQKKLIDFTFKKYKSTKLIENISNNQIFLNRKEIGLLTLNIETLENELIEVLINYKDIHKAVSAHTLQRTEFTRAPLSLVQEGYNQKLSGDIIFTLEPTIISNGYVKGGTTHGTGYNYDTHVPIIFYGGNIAKGKAIKKPVSITQIAPTISNILKIQEPNMSSLDILIEVFEKDKE